MAENEMNLFDQLPEAQPAVGTGTVEKSADAKKRELLKHAMEQTLKTNGAAYTQVLRTKTNDIEVTGAAIFSDKGSIIETEKAVGKRNTPGYKPHKVQGVGKIVGFFIKNTSAEPIEYDAMQYSLKDGRYEGEPIKAVIAPGATVALRKVDFVKLMCRPEYSFTAKNGKVRPGGGKRQNGVMTLEDQLSAYTFAFDDGSSVNDKAQQVGVQNADDTWAVAEEYVPVFGYCNNPEENPSNNDSKSSAKKNRPAFESQDYNANYIRMLLEQNSAQA
mgnify:CR=1 FL=1